MAPVVTCARSLYLLQLLPAGKLLRDIWVASLRFTAHQHALKAKYERAILCGRARLRTENMGCIHYSLSVEGIIYQTTKTRLVG
jgi:hypothetical protein